MSYNCKDVEVLSESWVLEEYGADNFGHRMSLAKSIGFMYLGSAKFSFLRFLNTFFEG